MDLTIAVPLVIGLVWVARKTELISQRFIPLFTVILSESLFLLLGVGEVRDLVIEGFITALSAMGMWSGVKNTLQG